ncbi:MAG TPA: hypothetical protein P5551_01555 [Syntrophales bacterium]|nr:hypothetical protein [Syntrophales bacterium]HRT61033.1 hypothetical protein [Syntrophales bacterium]
MLRAVDVQQILLQTNPVERIQQTQQQQSDMQQRHFAVEVGLEKKIMEEKVKVADETERPGIQREEEEKRKRHSKDSRSDREHSAEAADKEAAEDKPQGRWIDVKV